MPPPPDLRVFVTLKRTASASVAECMTSGSVTACSNGNGLLRLVWAHGCKRCAVVFGNGKQN